MYFTNNMLSKTRSNVYGKWMEKLSFFLACVCTDKVKKEMWGTTWRVTDELVTWRVSTTEAPIIPTWYRYTLDKQHVLCLC